MSAPVQFRTGGAIHQGLRIGGAIGPSGPLQSQHSLVDGPHHGTPPFCVVLSLVITLLSPGPSGWGAGSMHERNTLGGDATLLFVG